jgi:CheY-like chemotaxis protein
MSAVSECGSFARGLPSSSAVILIVDDHPVTLHALAQLLRLRGHDARTAPSGHAALNFLNQVHPNLIILDLCMRDIDGLKVLRILRADPRHRHTNVIVFTGEADRIDDALATGAQAAFIKGDTSWDRFLHQVDCAA